MQRAERDRGADLDADPDAAAWEQEGSRHPSAFRHRAAATIPVRFGLMLRSFMLCCCGVACLAGAASVFEPSSLLAKYIPAPEASATQRAHNEFTNTLANLILRSVDVLAVHQRGITPHVEMVIWLEDRVNPGVIDPHELAVVSHSQLFRTITAYTLVPSRGSMTDNAPRVAQGAPQGVLSRAGESLGSGSALNLDAPITPQQAANPSFCNQWRALPQVQSRLIASGISDMAIKLTPSATPLAVPTSDAPTRGPRTLTLRLRWVGDSTDGASDATVQVSLDRRPPAH